MEDAELIEKYLADMAWRELSPATIQTRRYYLRKFAKEVGFRQAAPAVIQEWLMRPSLQPQTRKMWLSLLSGIYQFAARRGIYAKVADEHGNMVDFDPTSDIAKPKSHKGHPRPISDEDLMTALANADRLMTCWLKLGAGCGCRCQEIALIERADIHDSDLEPSLTIVHGKGNKERDVVLPTDVLDALNTWGMPAEGRLWSLTPQQMSREINDFLHGLGIKSTAHTLRHYFGTHLYRISLDLQFVADQMGHANTAITSVYAKADHRKAHAIMANFKIGQMEQIEAA